MSAIKLKPKPGTKIADAPLHLRVVWRLTTNFERRNDKADLLALAAEEQVTQAEIIQAMKDLTDGERVEVLDATKFPVIQYSIPAKTMVLVAQDARSYRIHLEGKLGRKLRREVRADLPAITPEERAKWLAKAKPLAVKLAALEKDCIAHKLAGCMARIGFEEVKTLVAQVEAGHKPEADAVNRFLLLYCQKRDELHPLTVQP